jgi:hypothetical protein
VDIAYVVGAAAADQPALTAPARIIGMRSQGDSIHRSPQRALVKRLGD